MRQAESQFFKRRSHLSLASCACMLSWIFGDFGTSWQHHCLMKSLVIICVRGAKGGTQLNDSRKVEITLYYFQHLGTLLEIPVGI